MCNEEGRIDGLPDNPFSWTELLGPPAGNQGTGVQGTVFLVGMTEWGEFESLTDEQVAKLTAFLLSIDAQPVDLS